MKSYISCIVAVFCLFCIANATTWYVHPDSTLNSIQDGMDMCATGDTVLVGAGTYTENLNFHGMAMTVMSEYGADTTIIDGSSPTHLDTGSVVMFISGEDTNSVIKGFTITNGTGFNDPYWGAEGGGILCISSSPMIADNIICYNTAVWGGGIECFDNSHPIIMDNSIFNNTAGTGSNGGGGGIDMAFGSAPRIIGNLISANTAPYAGGISIDSLTQPLVRRNTITDNVASLYGGGIGCYNNSSATIDSCVISGNSTWGVQSADSDTKINYCNIVDNVGYGVYNYGPDTIDAEYNWWGDASGPSGAGPGTGSMVSTYVDFDPWLTSPGIGELIPSTTVRLSLQVSPNPFTKLTTVSFGIEHGAERMGLSIYDATGRLVKSFNQVSSIENQVSSVVWNGCDDHGRQLSSGVYFVQLVAGNCSTSQKVLLVR
ncbi:MAG: right-handed parallel beta-helix repeat-containing protein [candidate division WOR-3 bacterium]|nr:MAG: right-handed parallel beta-helix repeat-containing protein [candidate division WOR-3 bacterium]